MPDCKILKADCSGVHALKLVGEVRLTSCAMIDSSIELITSDPDFKTIVVDLTEASLVDSTTLGLLVKLAIKAKEASNCIPSVISTNPDITRVIQSMGFESVYLISEEPLVTSEALYEIAWCDATEDQTKQQVLEAHRTLMKLNDHNKQRFKDLVQVLELSQTSQIQAAGY